MTEPIEQFQARPENPGQEHTFSIAPVVDDPERMLHYLVSVAAEGDVVNGQQFARAAGDMIRDLGVMPVMSTCYVSRYPVNPFTHSVKDIWTAMCGKGMDRAVFAHHYPELTTALDLLLGITPEQIAEDPRPQEVHEDSSNERPIMGKTDNPTS